MQCIVYWGPQRPSSGGPQPLSAGPGETYLLSQAAWIVHYRWRATKPINFILKFYL